MGIENLDIVVRAVDQASGTLEGIGSKLGHLGEIAAGIGVAGVTAVTGAIIGGVSAAVDWGGKLNDLSDTLGTTADESAGLTLAIERVGGNTDAISGQMVKLTKNLVDSKGKLTATGKELQDLGISAYGAGQSVTTTGKALSGVKLDKLQGDLKGATARLHDMESAMSHAKHPTETATLALENQRAKVAALTSQLSAGGKVITSTLTEQGPLKPASQLLQEVATKLSAMPEGIEKTNLMVKLFGRSGKDLNDTMNALANGGLQASEEMAKKLGLAIGEDGVEQGKALAISMKDLEFAGKGLAVSIGSAVLPLLVPFAQKLAALAVDVMPKVREAIQSIAKWLSDTLGPALSTVARAVGGFFDELQTGASSGDFLGGLANGLESLAAITHIPIFDTLSGVVAKLDDVFGTLFGDLQSGRDPFESIADAIYSLLTAFGMGKDAATGFARTFFAIGSTVSGVIDGIVSAITGSETSFGDWSLWFENLASVAGPGFASAMDSVVQVIFGIKDAIQKIIPQLQGAVSDIITALSTGDTGPLLARVKEWAGVFLNWIATSVIPFIGARIGELITTLGGLIATYGPVLAAQLLTWGAAFLNFITTGVIPFIGTQIVNLALAIGSGITSQLPILHARLSDWSGTFLSWIDTDVIPFIAPKLAGIGTAIGAWIVGEVGVIGAQFSAWGAAFTDWIVKDVIPSLPAKLLAFATALYTWVHDLASNITQHSAELAEKITAWINEKAIPFLRTEFPKFVLVLAALIVAIPLALVATLAIVALAIVNGIVDGIKNFIQQKVGVLIEGGRDIINGLIEGMEKAADQVVATLIKIINDSIGGVKAFFNWHSPPPFAVAMGSDIGHAVASGILSASNAVQGAMKTLIGDASITQGLTDGIAGFGALPQVQLQGVIGSVTGGVGGVSASRISPALSAAPALAAGGASSEPMNITVNVRIGTTQIKGELEEIIYDAIRSAF